MVKKMDNKTFGDSQYAIIKYMKAKAGNDYIHKARVIVSFKGKTQYSSILKVVPNIDTNNSVVVIVGDDQFDKQYYNKYTNEYQRFTFSNDVLSIKGVDKLRNLIEIYIISI